MEFLAAWSQRVVSNPTSKCSDNAGMNDTIRQAFLNEHNRLRSSVARGLEVDGAGGKAPKAAKMLKMIYDCDVENSAMKHASKCIFEHSTYAERNNNGENLFKTSILKLDKAEAAKRASQSWWSELKSFGVGQANNLTMAVFNKFVGHYTQMAWEKSYKLGCAVMHCPKMTMVNCQYSPTGNYINQLIYTKGEPCSGCPGKCNKAEGLCNA
ncbi:SCP-like protein [Oesophagostomum dentatum]|uniref:SCP-like protein n=1 Tax=Oesophagostomum dentatum TaxID=61180 RepID=A0A0B1RYT4_OESDE|nr:SCP-like protein [Oesophagostomum dentatum]